METLKKILSLDFLTGYRTYIGAAGQVLSGIAGLGVAVHLWLDPATQKDAAYGAAVASLALISHGLSTLGLGKKLDDYLGTDALEKIDSLLPPSPPPVVFDYIHGDATSLQYAVDSAVTNGGNAFLKSDAGEMTYIPSKNPSVPALEDTQEHTPLKPLS